MFLFLAIQISQAVLIQLIQLGISTDFVCTQLNVTQSAGAVEYTDCFPAEG